MLWSGGTLVQNICRKGGQNMFGMTDMAVEAHRLVQDSVCT